MIIKQLLRQLDRHVIFASTPAGNEFPWRKSLAAILLCDDPGRAPGDGSGESLLMSTPVPGEDDRLAVRAALANESMESVLSIWSSTLPCRMLHSSAPWVYIGLPARSRAPSRLQRKQLDSLLVFPQEGGVSTGRKGVVSAPRVLKGCEMSPVVKSIRPQNSRLVFQAAGKPSRLI